MEKPSIYALAMLAVISLTARLPGAAPSGLSGTWLVGSSSWESARDLARTKVVLTEHTFSLTGYRRQVRPWTGTFTVVGEHALDFHVEDFEVGLPQSTKIRVPATDVHAAFKIERIDGVDHLTICYPLHPGQPRPTRFDEAIGADDPRLIKLVRADEYFVDFKKDVTITVLNPDGTPAVSAYVFNRMQHFPAVVSKDGGKTFTFDLSQPQKWSYWGDTDLKSDANGKMHLPFATFENADGAPVGVRDDAHNRTAFFYPSAALLARGAFSVRLSAVRVVKGSVRPDVDVISFSPMASLGPAEYWADKGEFEFPVPPGTYLLSVYGMELYSYRKWVTVPDGPAETTIDTGKLVVHVSQGPSLIGKTAPPIEGVVAWKNGPIELKSLRGKIVLVNFWGYWCGGCVNEMPTLFHLYDKYKTRGLPSSAYMSMRAAKSTRWRNWTSAPPNAVTDSGKAGTFPSPPR